MVTNGGPSDAENATLVDALAPTLSEASVSTDVGSCAVEGADVSCDLGTLPTGGTATIDVEALLAADASGALSNTASVSTTTPDPDPANDSATVTSDIEVAADLSLTKTGSPATAGAGDTVAYAVRVVNDGPSSATGVVVVDPLAADLSYVEGTCTTTAGTCASADGVLTFEIGGLDPGAPADLTYTALVAPDAPDEQLVNTATVSATSPDPDPSNDSASYTLNVDGAADVVLTKTSSAASVAAGEEVGFTITVRNDGPGAAADLDLTDAVPAAIAIGSVTPSAGACDSGTSNAVHCTLDALAVGGEWTIEIAGTVAPGTASGVLRNTATVTVDDDPTVSNNTATAIVQVRARADLSITKTAPPTVVAGEQLTYAIEVANDGPSTALSAVVVDRLPTGTTFVSGGGADVTCAPQAGSLRLIVCPLGDLEPGGAPVALTITVRVGPAVADGTTIVNTAQVSSPTPGLSDGLIAEAATLVSASADLEVIKLVQPDLLVAGASGSYLIRVLNRGPSAATDLVLTDEVPDGLVVESASPSGGSCTVTGQSVSCERASLSVDATWSVIIHFSVAPDALGTVTNSATVSSATADPDDQNDTGIVTTQVEASADLALVKTALFPSRLAGETAVFFVTAINFGPSVAQGVTVEDEVPDGLTISAVTSDACAVVLQTVSCDFGAIDPGDTRTVAVLATVDDDVTEADLVNSAVAATETLDPDETNNADEATVHVAPAADLAIEKTVSPGTLHPGSTATYLVRVVNDGPSTATSVRVSDSLPPELTASSATADEGACTVSAGRSVVCERDSLASGATWSITIRVEVATSASGTVVNTATVTSATADPDDTNNTASVSALATSPLPPTGLGSGVSWAALTGGAALLLGLVLVGLRRRSDPCDDTMRRMSMSRPSS